MNRMDEVQSDGQIHGSAVWSGQLPGMRVDTLPIARISQIGISFSATVQQS
jgi:hypothetical protein